METIVEVFIWNREIDLGRILSSQIRSSNGVAVFWLADRFVSGIERCMMVRKYPRRLKNLNEFEGCLLDF